MRKRNISLKRHTKFFVLYKRRVATGDEAFHRAVQFLMDQYDTTLKNLVNR